MDRLRIGIAISCAVTFLHAANTWCAGQVPANADATTQAMQARSLSDEEVAKLEQTLIDKPDDLDARTQLIGYWWARGMGLPSLPADDNRIKHVMWLIRNKPEAPILGVPYAEIHGFQWSKEFRALWLEQIEKQSANVAVLSNAIQFFTLNDRDLAIKLTKQAREIDPDNPHWSQKLGRLYLQNAWGRNGIDSKKAAEALSELEDSLNKSDSQSRFYQLSEVAKTALAAGDDDKARTYAKELLAQAVEIGSNDWNYGNAIHHGNLVLGQLALADGDVNKAGEYLLRAGKTLGSPQLNSFGPNMTLAKALLDANQDAIVIEYLKLCGTFWTPSWTQPQLQSWIKDIESGRTPHFGANLRY